MGLGSSVWGMASLRWRLGSLLGWVLRRCFLVLAMSNCMSWLLMLPSLLTPLIGQLLTVRLVVSGCLPGSERSTLLIIIRLG